MPLGLGAVGLVCDVAECDLKWWDRPWKHKAKEIPFHSNIIPDIFLPRGDLAGSKKHLMCPHCDFTAGIDHNSPDIVRRFFHNFKGHKLKCKNGGIKLNQRLKKPHKVTFHMSLEQ